MRTGIAHDPVSLFCCSTVPTHAPTLLTCPRSRSWRRAPSWMNASGRAKHTRLHELGELVWPAPVPGGLQAATEDDVELLMEWFGAFMGDADEQAGRPRGASAHEAPDRAEMLRRLRTGRLWFWITEAGERVHLTNASPPSFGVARVGPVYTPPAQRGRGWASNAVAEISRRIQAEGARVCLFTDQANPTSNKIYAALGYQPVADM